MHSRRFWYFFSVSLLLTAGSLYPQKKGLLLNKAPEKGYVLFAPLFSKETFLIDRKGNFLHSWKSNYNPAQSVYLLSDGSLLRTGNDSSAFFSGGGGIIEKISWHSKVEWTFKISDSLHRQHHDICPLPNGNVLVLCWEWKSRQAAIDAGRDSSLLGKGVWNEKIIEIRPEKDNSAAVVWEWSAWDHLIQDHDPTKQNYGKVHLNPGRIDINAGATVTEDWLHFNSIDYNEELDQILISNRNLSEIYIIDHGASTESADTAGRGSSRAGDLLYRWGNPRMYKKGGAREQKLFRQHHAHWIRKGLRDEGKIMVFNNGVGRGEKEFSSVEILNVPLNKGPYPSVSGVFPPLRPEWIYTGSPEESFYSYNVSSAERLPGGNTLICEGAEGRFFEIAASREIVWMYVNPVGPMTDNGRIHQNQVFRCHFISAGDPALKKRKFSGPRAGLNRAKHRRQ